MKKIVGIVGTGMIACSLAVLTTGNGSQTYLYARSDSSAKRAKETWRQHFELLKEHGVVSESQISACESYLHIVTSYKDLVSVQIVFEAIVEDLDQKHEVYRHLENHCPDIEVICSASSAIVPDLLSEGIEKYGDRIIVAHPFNPAHIVPYFELCGGKQTREGVLEAAKAYLESMGRKPVILKKPTPGFIGNRLQFALWRECLALVEEGICDPHDIDTALNYSFCPRYTSIGIFEHFDNGGMELCKHTMDLLFPILSNQKETPSEVNQMIAEGHTGVKSGQGFYNWQNVDMKAYAERVNEPYWRFCNWDLPSEEA